MQQMVHESLRCYSGDKLMCSGKEGNELWNPYWQVVRQVCHFTPPTKKVGTHGNTELLQKPKNSKCVSLYSVMQQGSAMLNSCIRAQQAMWTLALIHWHPYWAVWDLDICHEEWAFSMTVQPHTAHVRHESGYSHFIGNLWTIHPIVLDFALLDCHLSGPLKQHLGCCWFHSNNKLEMAVREWVHTQEPEFSTIEFFRLVPRWDKYICVIGESIKI
jgi:hypothetical protein